MRKWNTCIVHWNQKKCFVAIATTGRLRLRWQPTDSWRVGEMQIFAFSKRSLWYFGKEKKTETGEGLLRTRICSIIYNYFDSCEVPSPPFAGWDEPFRNCWEYQYNLYSSTNERIDKIIKELANKCRHREQILYNV